LHMDNSDLWSVFGSGKPDIHDSHFSPRTRQSRELRL
jgi:hypothetical protein